MGPIPFVNNEQGILPVLGHEFTDSAVASGNLELYQQNREPDVLHRIEPFCGSHAQSAGQIRFAAAVKLLQCLLSVETRGDHRNSRGEGARNAAFHVPLPG